jgi:NAD(P)-dependent dehydrogenase (short-subunit alcohol dehydrogenase family)
VNAKALEGRVALVTGAAAGIGAAIAKRLSEHGAAIALVDLKEDEARSVASGLSSRAEVFAADLADANAATALVPKVLASFGRIDILVNCAGITGGVSTLAATTLEIWDQVYAVNARAPFLLTRAAAPHMIERGSGRIVNISSSSAFRARMSAPAYGSSKAAIAQLTRLSAAELGPHGINVNAIAPGLTRSAMTAGFKPDALERALKEGPISNLLGRISEPEDIAATALFLCLPESRQITGQILHVDGGAVTR